MTKWPAPVCLAEPQPGDFTCIPVSGGLGLSIEIGQFLAGDGFQPYDHAEVYAGQADRHGPHGYTYSAYPDNLKPGKSGKRPLPCPPAKLPGSYWSSGILALTAAQRSGIVAWCEAHPRVPYSWEDYGALTLHGLHIPAPGLRDYIASTFSMICSWYTDASWWYGGDVHLFSDNRWPGYVKPGDLVKLLEKCRKVLAGP